MFEFAAVSQSVDHGPEVSWYEDEIEIERASELEQRFDAEVVTGFSARNRTLLKAELLGKCELAQPFRFPGSLETLSNIRFFDYHAITIRYNA